MPDQEPQARPTRRPYFTIDQANAIVPRLEEIFGRVIRLRSQLQAVRAELEKLGHPPTPKLLQSPPTSPPALQRAVALFRGIVETLQEELAEVEEIGAMVKDVETGLVDLWARRGGKDVLLCWRYGEKEVAFWHDPESGFAGRKPIDAAERARFGGLH